MPSLKIEITRNFVEVRELSEEIILGRGRQADIVLLHASVSRRHARVYQKNNLYAIEDLNSSNGRTSRSCGMATRTGRRTAAHPMVNSR